MYLTHPHLIAGRDIGAASEGRSPGAAALGEGRGSDSTGTHFAYRRRKRRRRSLIHAVHETTAKNGINQH